MVEINKEQERDLLIFNLIQRRLDGEWQRLRDLDSKASNMIGFVSVAVSLLLGTGTISFMNVGTLDPNLASFFFVGTGLLIGSIILGMVGYKVREWTDVPDVRHLIDEYKDKPYGKVLQKNAGTMAKVVEELEDKLNDKARFIDIAWYLLIAGLILVFIFVIIVLTSGVQVYKA